MKKRPPEDYSALFHCDPPVVVVGGQAVGIWVSVFASGRERSPYDAFRPMVSADMDVWGDLETLRYLARVTGWKAETSRQRLQFQNLETGRLVGLAPDGLLVVQVLHAVHGLTRGELESSRTVKLEAGVIRVPSPPLLFRAKLANLRDIDQSERNDLKHAMALTFVLADYFDMLTQTCREATRDERELVKEAGMVLRTLKTFRKVIEEYRIPTGHIFPSRFRESPLPKLRSFVRHQLVGEKPQE